MHSFLWRLKRASGGMGRSVNITSDRPWQVVFEARILDFYSTESGILLDDIEIQEGACSDQQACTFEGPTCLTWENSHDLYASGWWHHERAGLSVFHSDHTTGNPEGHYLRFSADAPGQLAVLTAAGGSGDARCATFWYLLSDELRGLILLAGPTYFNESTHGQWRSAQFSLTNNYRSIIAVSGTNPKAFALVDDLLVSEDDCTTEASTCGKGMFSCRDGKHCVPALLICDGVRDCPNGADELCGGHEYCSGAHYSCRKPSICIDASKLCDGHEDCSDGSDEVLCNDCPLYFCRNEGNCSLHSMSGAPECTCTAGFQGTRCQRKLHTADLIVAGSSGGWAYGAPILVLVILGLTAAVIIYVRRKRNNEARREMEQSSPVSVENPIYGLEFGQEAMPNRSTQPRDSWLSRTFRFPRTSRICTSEC
ncbi:hypothetical protein MTO96_013764 [Rhipicephalus appendiculatus]